MDKLNQHVPQISCLLDFNFVGLVTLGRAQRQGDPLSPYLFILCVEGQSTLVQKAMAKGEVYGVKLQENAPIISHMFTTTNNGFNIAKLTPVLGKINVNKNVVAIS